MRHDTPTRSSRGAVATGASATGAASLAAMAMGAVALGALAVGALAVGRLTVGRARLRRVEIGELAIGRLELGSAAGRPAALRRVRAAPGKGDALERLLLDAIAAAAPGLPPCRAHRSRTDPDLFLFYALVGPDPEPGQAPPMPELDALLRRAAGRKLLAEGGEGAGAVELYRTL